MLLVLCEVKDCMVYVKWYHCTAYSYCLGDLHEETLITAALEHYACIHTHAHSQGSNALIYVKSICYYYYYVCNIFVFMLM